MNCAKSVKMIVILGCIVVNLVGKNLKTFVRTFRFRQVFH